MGCIRDVWPGDPADPAVVPPGRKAQRYRGLLQELLRCVSGEATARPSRALRSDTWLSQMKSLRASAANRCPPPNVLHKAEWGRRRGFAGLEFAHEAGLAYGRSRAVTLVVFGGIGKRPAYPCRKSSSRQGSERLLASVARWIFGATYGLLSGWKGWGA